MRMPSKRSLQGLLALTATLPLAVGFLCLDSSQPVGTQARQWLATMLPAAWQAEPASSPQLTDFGQIALHFEPNVGQAPDAVNFLARGTGYALLLTGNEAVFHLSRPAANSRPDDAVPRLERAVLRAQLVNANTKPRVAGLEKQPSYSNYFIGNNPRDWHAGVAHYGRVRYSQVWPGIDLVYYGNQQQLEYDFLVQPGVNPEVIRLRYQGAQGLHVDAEGGLVAETALGPVRQLPPVVYQENWSGGRDTVAAHYTISGNEVGFSLGEYDRSRPLVIDPVLVYSSYLGGGGNNNFNLTGIAVTPGGVAYVSGYTDSASFTTLLPYQAARQAPINSVITRFSNNGRSLAWSTYLGGSTYAAGGTSASGRAATIAVDAEGNAWVAGTTLANNFPIPDGVTPLQSSGNVHGAGFLTKIARDGQSLLYSTYLSGTTSINGSAGDAITALALAADGSVWMAGSAGSSNFPLANARQMTRPGGTNSTGFVSHLAANGLSLSHSSYLGGSGVDTPSRVVLAAGDVFVAGKTTSTDFPKTDASLLNGTGTGSAADAFVSRLSADGQTLKHSRYLGGSGDDAAYGLAVDGSGNAFVAGATKSTDFPLQNALSSENSKSDGSVDTAFLTRFNNDGSLGFSTFLGSSGYASALALTSAGEPVVAGRMAATFTQEDAVKDGDTVIAPTDNGNGFVRRLSADGQTLLFSTALGGSQSDEAITALALDDGDAIYVAGNTLSTDFPTKFATQSYSSDFARSGFVSKIAYGPDVTITVYPSTVGLNMDAILAWTSPTATNCVWDDAGDLGITGNRKVNESVADHYDYTLRCTNSSGTRAQTATLEVIPPPSATLSLSKLNAAVGQTVVMSWSSANATACSLNVTQPDSDGDGNEEVVLTIPKEYMPLNGSEDLVLTATDLGTVNIKLTCTGPGSKDEDTDSKTLTVINAPTLSLTGTPQRTPLFIGDTINYVWSSTHAGTCEASGLISGTVATADNRTVTTTAVGSQGLSLSCEGATGAKETKTLNYTVYDAGSDPVLSLAASASSIKLYESTALTWSASNAETCTASGAWSGSRATSGSGFSVKPTSTGPTVYTLTCHRPAPGGGKVAKSVSITVNVTTPDAPTLSLLASPSTVAVGRPFTLSWNSVRTDSCTASGWSAWNGSKPVTGNSVLTPTSTGTLTLNLSCQSGDSSLAPVSRSVSITVTEQAATTASNSTEDSGGPVDFLLLGGLGLLGLARRKAR